MITTNSQLAGTIAEENPIWKSFLRELSTAENNMMLYHLIKEIQTSLNNNPGQPGIVYTIRGLLQFTSINPQRDSDLEKLKQVVDHIGKKYTPILQDINVMADPLEIIQSNINSRRMYDPRNSVTLEYTAKVVC